jgi:hypothetical protein
MKSLDPDRYPHGYAIAVLYEDTYPARDDRGAIVRKPEWVWSLEGQAFGADLTDTARLAATTPGGPHPGWPAPAGTLLAVWHPVAPLRQAAASIPAYTPHTSHPPQVVRVQPDGTLALVPPDQHAMITMLTGD